MALTREFRDTVRARMQVDAAYRAALFTEGVEALLAGDLETGKAVLRDYINGTVGFEALGEATGTPVKSLMRMFGPRGNPNARTLVAVIGLDDVVVVQSGDAVLVVPRARAQEVRDAVAAIERAGLGRFL